MKLFTSTAPETEDVGIANNDIDGFLKNLLDSVTREAAQNSNDESEVRPVTMNFDMETIPTDDVPDIDEFKAVIDNCLTEAQNARARKAEEFFNNAQRVLGRDNIPILTISDSGTKGAGGEFRKGGKFYTLAISQGRTEKDQVYSAGSFGIGKNASLAGSELRLVFYSSRFKSSDADQFYCLGKSILTSWRNDSNENMSHKVFFVKDSEDFSPETTQDDLPSWLHKDEGGLKVSIVAPRIELRDNWESGFIMSLLSSFFLAVHEGHIEFSLNKNDTILNSSTMLEYFDQPEVIQASENLGTEKNLTWAKQCSEALAADEFIREEISIDNLGDFEVLIKVGEGLPKKVLIVRNGMYITDNLAHFGKPLAQFRNTKEFIAIVRPKDINDTSSEMIKRMENPEHNHLTTSYIADDLEVIKLKAAVIKLEAGIRTIVRKHAKMEIQESRDIDELNKYFEQFGDNVTEQGDESDPTAITTDEKVRTKKPVSFTPGGGKGGKGKHGKKRIKTKTKTKGPGGKSGGTFSGTPYPCRAVRTSGTSWRIEVKNPPDDGHIEFWPEGLSRGSETKPVQILSCNTAGHKIKSDKLSVSIPVAKSTIQSIDLELDSDLNIINFRPVLHTQGVSK